MERAEMSVDYQLGADTAQILLHLRPAIIGKVSLFHVNGRILTINTKLHTRTFNIANMVSSSLRSVRA